MDGVCIMAKVTVGWAPYLDTEYAKGLAFFITKPLSVFDSRMRTGNHRYRLCPATRDLARNTFVVTAPFDAHFYLDADKRTIEFAGTGKQAFEFFNMRAEQYGPTDQPIMSINYYQLFVSQHDQVEMTMTAPWFEDSVAAFKIVPGRFNIGKWWRPLDVAMQLPERQQEIKIKQGDVLFYVTFSTGNSDDVVVLREIAVTKELQNFCNLATGVKHYKPQCPFKTLYGWFKQFKHKPKLEFID